MSLVKIANRTLGSITWKTAGSDFVPADKADIWRINISSNLPLAEDFLSVLQPAETDRANRYIQEKDKKRSIISRGALRIILGRYLNQRPGVIDFAQGPNKKPYIAGETGLHFNLSHSGDWILLAIAGSEIGADIEFIKPNFDYREIMRDIFSPEECDHFNQYPSTERFFTLWTRKEALIKATGQGLDENLKSIPGLDGDQFVDSPLLAQTNDWVISSFNVHQHYAASVACNAAVNEMRFFDIDFTGGV